MKAVKLSTNNPTRRELIKRIAVLSSMASMPMMSTVALASSKKKVRNLCIMGHVADALKVA